MCKPYLEEIIHGLEDGEDRKDEVKIYQKIFRYPHAIFKNEAGDCDMMTIAVNSGGGGSQKAKNKTRRAPPKAKIKHTVNKTHSK